MDAILIKITSLNPNTGQIPGVPANPRFIKDDNYEKLKQSIIDDPEMLDLRELLVYPNPDKKGHYVIIGGNMRYRICKELGYKEIPSKIIPKGTSPDKLRAYLIKDNVGFGSWDMDMLGNSWDEKQLSDWGVDLYIDFDTNNVSENQYTSRVETPKYEPKNEKPKPEDLYNDDKYRRLLESIENSNVDENEKEFLRLAAARHVVIDFSKVADYFCNSDEETQELMRESALIIIDFNRAIEEGYVRLTKDITEQFIEEYEGVEG